LIASGFAARVAKPVRTGELLECVENALAHGAQEWHLVSQPMAAYASAPAVQLPHYPIRVLLVEDNAVNQRVAQRFLERFGCTVTIAVDGAEAVDFHDLQHYDLILMDMQMPVMDGLEATRRIREGEANGSRHTPIVALTADAMRGTFERCMEAGMDAYLTKPLDIAHLQSMLDKFAGAGAMRPVELQAAAAARLAELTDGDEEFYDELISTFIIGGREALREMQQAVERGDKETLGRQAHRLKGASANLHLQQLTAIAATVESNARQQVEADWSGDVAKMSTEFERTAQALQARKIAGA
jgi:two-component system sensor histidine kinase/response regulator